MGGAELDLMLASSAFASEAENGSQQQVQNWQEGLMQRPILRRAEMRKGSTGQRVVVLGVIDELVQEVGNEMVLLHPFLRFHHQTLRRLVCVYFT